MKNSRPMAALLLLSIFSIMSIFSWWVIGRADRQMRADLLQQTRLVAQALEVEHVLALSGTEADIESLHYRRLKEQLTAVRSANPQCRFVYLMGRKADGTVFFFVDSEPAGSKDYSPPGQIYDESTADFLRVFDTKVAAVEGPVTDRWGTWISTMVPIIGPQVGDVVAVLGMDIYARLWKWDVAERAALPLGLMLVLLIGAVASFVSTRRIAASPKPVLRRLMPSLTVMVILLIIGMLALIYQQHRRQLDKEITVDISEISSDLGIALNQQAFALAMAAQPIAANVNVQKDLRDRDTEHLLATWQPVFEKLQRENHLTHFYFYDENRVCLLRIHNPEQRGDIINRFTALEAERTGKNASGIELGPLGTFTLRMVQPVLESGRLVGYVELGKEIEDVLKSMHVRPGNQLAVTIHKAYLNRQTWENGMHLLGRQADWDQLPHSVIIYASQGRLPGALVPLANHDGDNHPHGETDREIAFDGKTWRISVMPLPDVSGAEIGDLLILHDITAEKTDFVRLLVLGGTAGAVLLVLLLSFIYVLLRRTDRGIQAQQSELRDSEERFRLLFDGSKDAIVVYRLNDHDGLPGQFILVNQEACIRLGYLREELLRMTPLDISVPEMTEQREMAAEQLKTVGSSLFETYQMSKDGRCIPVECFDRVLTIDGGMAVLSTSRDITVRKQVEETLRESENSFSQLFESAPVAMAFASDIDKYRGTTWNKAWYQTFGYAREIADGRSGNDIGLWVNPENRVRFVDMANQQNYVADFEALLRCHDGSVRNCSLFGRFIDKAGHRLLMAIYLDITDRKQAEETLRESEEKFRLTFSFSPDSVSISSLDDGRYLDVNEGFIRATGFTREEVIGKTSQELNIWYDPSDREKLIQGLQANGIIENLETQFRCKDGSLIVSLLSARIISLKGIPRIITIVRDITELKALTSKIQQVQRFEAIGSLAGGIAHDFNNLLMGIQGRISLMSLDIANSLPNLEHIQAIEGYIQSASNLTKQLLGLARGGKYEVSPIDINELVIASSAMFGRTKKEIQIHTKCQESALVVEADRGQIEQVLLNVYINAWQAMPPTGGDIYLETKSVALDETYCKSRQIETGRYVKVSVTDTGIGMDEVTRLQVFDPFFTTKDKGRGTGLGLASAYGIIKNHGGTITVYSEIGHGTTFNIYLPQSVKQSQPENRVERDIIKGKETILFVDDEALIIDVGQAMLESLGYRVIIGRNGQEAIHLITELGKQIDLVILDMIMPGMDGGTTFDRIREIHPDIPVILSSGYTINGHANKIMRRGCKGFIQKPYNISALSQKIRKVLDESKGSSQQLLSYS